MASLFSLGLLSGFDSNIRPFLGSAFVADNISVFLITFAGLIGLVAFGALLVRMYWGLRIAARNAFASSWWLTGALILSSLLVVLQLSIPAINTLTFFFSGSSFLDLFRVSGAVCALLFFVLFVAVLQDQGSVQQLTATPFRPVPTYVSSLYTFLKTQIVRPAVFKSVSRAFLVIVSIASLFIGRQRYEYFTDQTSFCVSIGQKDVDAAVTFVSSRYVVLRGPSPESSFFVVWPSEGETLAFGDCTS